MNRFISLFTNAVILSAMPDQKGPSVILTGIKIDGQQNVGSHPGDDVQWLYLIVVCNQKIKAESISN
jgi:hypothetical protein